MSEPTEQKFRRWQRIEARHSMNDCHPWTEATYMAPDFACPGWHIVLFPDGAEYYTAYVRPAFERKVTALHE